MFDIIIFLAVSVFVFAIIFIIVRILRKRKNSVSQEVAQCVLTDSDINKFSQYFVNREEKYISSLGNSYIMNFLSSGNLRRGFAIISDKRVYFRGNCFSGHGKILVKTNEERTVDIKDVTGSGFIYRRHLGILLGLFVSLVTLICGIVLLVSLISSVVKTDKENKERIERNAEEYAREYEEEYERRSQEVADALLAAEYFETEDLQETLEDLLPEILEVSSLEYILLDFDCSDNIAHYIGRCWEEEGCPDSPKVIAQIIRQYSKEYLEHTPDKRKFHSNTIYILTFGELVGLLSAFLISCFKVFLTYLKKRKTRFQIQYAGGCIAFDVSYYAKAEIDDFQKQLRRAKDSVEESVAKVTVNESPVQSTAQNNVPDELRKYSDLLKEGLISQEEYDAMKKKLLGL